MPEVSHDSIRMSELRADIIKNVILLLYKCTGILSTLRWWRPPSNGVLKNSLIIMSASSVLMNRPGMTSTLASLCWRAKWAISAVQQRAARIP